MTAGLRSPKARWILVALFLVSLVGVTTRLGAADEIEYFSWLRSWTFDHDVDFRNEYGHFYDAGPDRLRGFRATFLDLTNEAGRAPNFAPIGTAILWAPFYAVGHVAAMLTGQPANGYSPPYITAVTWASAGYGFAALWLSWAIARRLLGHGGTATMATALGTPIVFYMYVAPGFSHAASAFAVSLFIWIWLKVRESWSPSGMALLALVGALLPMVREQDVFFLVGPALDFSRAMILTVPGNRRRPLLGVITSAVVFLLAYAPQLIAYDALNGHPSPTHLVARKMTWSSPHFMGVLFSPEHGFFVWTPLAIVACAGLVAMAAGRVPGLHRDTRWLTALFLVQIALQAYVSGCVESWTVAGSFGQRRFVAVTPLLVVGLAALVPAMRNWRAHVMTAVVVLCVWWNIGLMAQFGLHRMDRQRMSPAENARVTFVELPLHAPSIVWRYVTNRESFYGLPQQ
ncbi:MAG: hypothetical protein ABI634_04455 [Acidobacteriota bacterium]